MSCSENRTHHQDPISDTQNTMVPLTRRRIFPNVTDRYTNNSIIASTKYCNNSSNFLPWPKPFQRISSCAGTVSTRSTSSSNSEEDGGNSFTERMIWGESSSIKKVLPGAPPMIVSMDGVASTQPTANRGPSMSSDPLDNRNLGSNKVTHSDMVADLKVDQDPEDWGYFVDC